MLFLGYALWLRAPFGAERWRFDSFSPDQIFFAGLAEKAGAWLPTRIEGSITPTPLQGRRSPTGRGAAPFAGLPAKVFCNTLGGKPPKDAEVVGSNPTVGRFIEGGVRFWRTGESHKLL